MRIIHMKGSLVEYIPDRIEPKVAIRFEMKEIKLIYKMCHVIGTRLNYI